MATPRAAASSATGASGAESPAGARRGGSVAKQRCRRVLAVASIALDPAVGVAVWIACRGGATDAFFGWTPQAPLALLPVRLLWLALLFLLAAWRAGRAATGACLAWLEWSLEEGFLYVVYLCLAAPCIVRLVSDRPDSVTTGDDTSFWAAVIPGCIFTSLEGTYTLGALPAFRTWAKRRSEARRPEAPGGMDVELLPNGAGAGEGRSGGGASSPGTSPGQRRGGGQGAEEEAGGEGAPKAPAVKKILQLVTVDWHLLLQAFVLLVLAAVSEVLIPHYIGETISEIIKAEEEHTLQSRPFKGPVVRLLISAACCGIFSSCRGATFIRIGGRASVRLRQSLFDTLMRQEIGFFDTTKTGELTSRMTQDCQKVSDQVTLNVNVFLRTMVSTITTLAFMYTLSGALTLVAFISVPAIVVISKQYGKVMRKLSEETQKALADANTVAEEGLSTMATVRSFAAEGLESQRFGAKLSGYAKLVRNQANFYIVYLACTMMLPQAVTALVLFYGGKLAMEQRIKAGSLLSFVFYLQTLNSNFSTLGDFYSNMVQAIGAAQRVFDLSAREPKLPMDPPVGCAAAVGDYKGALRLEGVRFNYPARPEVEVLKGLSLEVPAGKVVALVGPSGNGKSTVIGLLKRLYKADEGSVTLDGVDLWKFEHRHFHRIVSIVGQEPVLYARTVRENIVCGLENPAGCPQTGGEAIDNERVFDAAKKANAHAFILEMPNGYDTEVGERGVQLSGGQKQRIAIARALVRQPKVLLLDEATSALDADSERQVQQAIDAMIADGCMTVVIIAHRLSTVKNSHKICVVQGGQVVEEGTHEDLIARGGSYFQLVQCQLSAQPAATNGADKKPAEAYSYGLTAHAWRNSQSMDVILHRIRANQTDRDSPVWRLTPSPNHGQHHYQITVENGIATSQAYNDGQSYGLTAHHWRNSQSMEVITHDVRSSSISGNRDWPVWRLQPAVDFGAHHYRIFMSNDGVSPNGDGAGYALTAHEDRDSDSRHVIIHQDRGLDIDTPVWRVQPAGAAGLFRIEMKDLSMLRNRSEVNTTSNIGSTTMTTTVVGVTVGRADCADSFVTAAGGTEPAVQAAEDGGAGRG